MIVPFICVHHTFIIFTHSEEKRTKALLKSLQSYCRMALKILQIELVYDFDPELIRNRLVISNHLSYVDVLCLSSLFPAAYITSVEIRETPVLGQICQLNGCLFTERRRAKRNAKTHAKEIEQMLTYLKSEINIVLFPESTTSEGHGVLPFKTSLLESGIHGNSHYQPLAITYSSPHVPWFGDDVSFVAHLWTLVSSDKIQAYISRGDSYQGIPGEGRKELGVRLHGSVSELFEKSNSFKIKV
jgi:1-acyl-sn-glycerol-3-phosphate acyltransferase